MLDNFDNITYIHFIAIYQKVVYSVNFIKYPSNKY